MKKSEAGYGERLAVTVEYVYIQAWGRMLRSFDYFINAEIDRARADGAPATAVYRNADGTWTKIEDCCEGLDPPSP